MRAVNICWGERIRTVHTSGMSRCLLSGLLFDLSRFVTQNSLMGNSCRQAGGAEHTMLTCLNDSRWTIISSTWMQRPRNTRSQWCSGRKRFFLQDWEDSSPPLHWDLHRILETGFFWMSQETEAKLHTHLNILLKLLLVPQSPSLSERCSSFFTLTVESCCGCQNDHDSFHFQISMLICCLMFTCLELRDGCLQLFWLILLLLHPPPPLGFFSWLAPVFTLFSRQMKVWHCVEGGHYLKLNHTDSVMCWPEV